MVSDKNDKTIVVEIERASRIPGLGDIPVLGRLFSNTRTDGQKTEIVLSITPRVVRNITRPPMNVAALWSGTEATFRSAKPQLHLPEAPPRPAAQAPVANVSRGAPPAATAGGEAFELNWKGPSQVKPGEEFVVLVEGASGVPLSSAELKLLFDPSMVTVVRIAEGDWLRGGGAQTVSGRRSAWRRVCSIAGFTLIELLVVMAIIATLASIAAPRYFNSLEKSRETALRSNLKVMREAIDQYHQDTGRWPGVLEDLVKNKYLREVPVDPITQDAATWLPVKQSDGTDTGIKDVRSGAPGAPRTGPKYEDW